MPKGSNGSRRRWFGKGICNVSGTSMELMEMGPERSGESEVTSVAMP